MKRLNLTEEELQLVIDSLDTCIQDGYWFTPMAGQLLEKLKNIQSTYVNWEAIDKMTDEEKKEMYDGFCKTFLDRSGEYKSYIDELRSKVATHPTTKDCPDPECLICGIRDCPYGEPLHYHHDGCPSCYEREVEHKDNE